MHGRSRHAFLMLALLGASALTRPAAAQGVVPPPPASPPPTAPGARPRDTLETVTVTAENRRTSAQKTPISMTVYDSRTIAAEQIHDTQSLAQLDPSLKFENQLGGDASLAIRGISSQDTTEIGDPAVSIDTDGFFVNRLVAVGATLYDLAQIEVLRGPQGTLYGRNSVGGDVNIFTQRPIDQFAAGGSVDVGNYNTVNADGFINVPINNRIQVRGAFSQRSHQGYRINPGFPRGDDEDTQSGRISIQAEPTDHLTLWAQVQYTHEGGTGPVSEGIPFNTVNGPLPGGGFGPVDISHALPAGINPTRWPIYAPFSLNIAETRVRWEAVQRDLPWDLKLTYSGGYDLIQDNEAADATALNTNPKIPSPFITKQRPATINQELLLTSRSDQRLIWQAGLFYFHEHNDVGSYQTALDGAVPGGTPQIAFELPNVNTDSYAAFAQASYDITHTLKLTLGGRETEDQKSRTGNSVIYPELFGIPPSVMNPAIPLEYIPDNGSVSFNKFTYTAELGWTPTATSFEYVKINTGYKAGGFNSNGVGPSLPYGPETVTNYELGTKNRFLHGRLELDATGFYDDYKGYQAEVFSCNLCSSPFSGIQNAGAARIFGLESTIDAIVNPLGKFGLQLAYLNARFTQFEAGLTNYITGATSDVNFAGNRLIQAPNLTVNASFEHDWPLPNDATLGFLINTNFQSKQYYSFQNTPDTLQNPYTVSNASFTYHAPSGLWQAMAYVNNLENSVSFDHAQENGDVAGYLYNFNPPRTFGVKLSFMLGAARE